MNGAAGASATGAAANVTTTMVLANGTTVTMTHPGTSQTSGAIGANGSSSSSSDISGGASMSNHTAAIAGGVVGGIVGLALIGLLFFLVARRRRRRQEDTEKKAGWWHFRQRRKSLNMEKGTGSSETAAALGGGAAAAGVRDSVVSTEHGDEFYPDPIRPASPNNYTPYGYGGGSPSVEKDKAAGIPSALWQYKRNSQGFVVPSRTDPMVNNAIVPLTPPLAIAKKVEGNGPAWGVDEKKSPIYPVQEENAADVFATPLASPTIEEESKTPAEYVEPESDFVRRASSPPPEIPQKSSFRAASPPPLEPPPKSLLRAPSPPPIEPPPKSSLRSPSPRLDPPPKSSMRSLSGVFNTAEEGSLAAGAAAAGASIFGFVSRSLSLNKRRPSITSQGSSGESMVSAKSQQHSSSTEATPRSAKSPSNVQDDVPPVPQFNVQAATPRLPQQESEENMKKGTTKHKVFSDDDLELGVPGASKRNSREVSAALAARRQRADGAEDDRPYLEELSDHRRRGSIADDASSQYSGASIYQGGSSVYSHSTGGRSRVATAGEWEGL